MARSRGKRRQRKGAGTGKAGEDVQLSRFDLSQLDEDYLAKLPEGQLRSLSVKLLADLKAAHERLDQNPDNSSRPPSSRAPWEGGEGDDRTSQPKQDKQPDSEAEDAAGGEEERRQSAEGSEGKKRPSDESAQQRRPGQRPGAPGHGRVQQLPIEQVHHHHPAIGSEGGP